MTNTSNRAAAESLKMVLDAELNAAGLDTNGPPYADDGEAQWPVAAELRDHLAAAVVAFLTSDESVERATVRIWPHVADNPRAYLATLSDVRAAIIAALVVESLPLDPEPWIVNKMGGSFRMSDPEDFGNVAFHPRPGYEQDPARYEKGTE